MSLLVPVTRHHLSIDQVDELVRLARQGVPYREIASRVACALSTVYTLLGAAVHGREGHRSELQLSLAEREEIRAGLERVKSFRAIARGLNRNVSTISREVGRNGGREAYRAWRADERAVQAARRPRTSKIAVNHELRKVIESKFQERWSPQQIAHHLRSTPHDKGMHASHETIYQSLFVQARGSSRFLDQTRLHRLYALFYLALTTGMRRGEMLGLHWKSVDLERGRLRVQHNVIDVKGGLRLETPKTRGSRRLIALPPDVVQVLEEHRGRMKVERRAREAKLRSWPSPQLVFVSEEGTALDPSNVIKSFRLLCEQAGVPSIRLHDLRHTAATLLIRRGVPAKLVADRLGHTDPGFTLRVYTHVFDEHREESALSLGDLLGTTGDQRTHGGSLGVN